MKNKEELNALKEEVETLNKKLSKLTDEELAQVAGGASMTSKVPKYSIGTWVYFIRETGDKALGIVDDITIIPEKYLDQYLDQFPDGFFYTIRNTEGGLYSWLLELVAEDRITGIYK